jgi:nanoRNase/pAp phosphatase (c-di-AMP/oligoRNAs hydrolase)
MPVEEKRPNAATMIMRMKSLLSTRKALLILVFPDPDSLSSAWAFQHVLKFLVPQLRVKFAYFGKISRLQNQAMVHLLNIPVFPVTHVDIDEFDTFATVDAQPSHFKLEKFPKRFHMVIDHHPIIDLKCAEVVDIRPDFGATASILVEYIRECHLELPDRLATAICYGIKSDTQAFTRYSKAADVQAFAYCFPYANQQLLRDIEFTEIPADSLAAFHRTLANLQVNKGRTYVHLGEMIETDTAVLIADFLIRVEHITWVVVSVVVNQKLVLIFRYNSDKSNAGKLAKRLFSEMGSAGGHKSAARAEIPLEKLGFEPEPDLIRKFVLEKLKLSSRSVEDVGSETPRAEPNDDRSFFDDMLQVARKIVRK